MGPFDVSKRIRSAEEAAAGIPDGATIAVSGNGGGMIEADTVLAAIGRRFLETGHPRGITLVHALGIGDGAGSGIGRLAHEGLVKRVIGGHWSWSPAMQKLAADNLIEAYSLPAGVIMTLLREIGAGRPGVITHIGLGTFADPRNGGGRINARATDDIVERVSFDGQDWLRYKPFKVDVAILRGSLADPHGNISLRHEPVDIDAYAVALAGRNSGGQVIVQVKGLADGNIVPARLARIPGILVDSIVVDPAQRQCQIADFDPAISGEIPGEEAPDPAPPTGIRRIVAARAARELKPGLSVNFGYGMPGGIPGLVAERGEHGTFWGSVEQGIHNGHMLDGPMFGAARFPQAILSSVDQFDFYSGGGVDVAFLGMGELDGEGNVNVSMLGPTVVGPGGFVDITQGARKLVFCGTFEAKGLDVVETGGRIEVRTPGSVPKLVSKVRHITFSGARARERGQEVLYVTERAVFRLAPEGIELMEVAPGIEVQRDVVSRMGFQPIVGDVRAMPLG
jgi:acyl CoA:acetate/3-ketoacid CoA transferase